MIRLRTDGTWRGKVSLKILLEEWAQGDERVCEFLHSAEPHPLLMAKLAKISSYSSFKTLYTTTTILLLVEALYTYTAAQTTTSKSVSRNCWEEQQQQLIKLTL